MARNRMISPEYWRDEKIAVLSRDARLLYVGLWNFADDKGRFRYNARVIRGDIFAYDESTTTADVQSWLDELEKIGRIVVYESNGEKYAHIPTFLDHQRIDKPQASRLPDPLSDNSTNIRRTFDEHSTSPRDEEKRREEKRREEKGIPPVVPQAGDSVKKADKVKDPSHISSTLDGLMARFPVSATPAPAKITTAHQQRAVDMAAKLGIVLDELGIKRASWFEIFRRAEKFGQGAAIDGAYSYMADWEPQTGERTSLSVALMFFWKYNEILAARKNKLPVEKKP